MRRNPTNSSGGEAGRLREAFGPREIPGKRYVGRGGARRGFTLLELLVVMAIIGILATIGLPSLSGLGGSLDINSANRQLADDIAFARLKAINDRTTVFMVFVSPTIITQRWSRLTELEARERDQLIGGQFTTYALYATRTLGDQPGAGTATYLTEWRTLPEGIFIETNKYNRLPEQAWRSLAPTNRPFAYFQVPFPTEESDPIWLPALAFDYQGKLVDPKGEVMQGDQVIQLSKGSIVFPRHPVTKKLVLEGAEVIETPPGNYTNNPAVRVDWLTGRARTVLPPPRES